MSGGFNELQVDVLRCHSPTDETHLQRAARKVSMEVRLRGCPLSGGVLGSATGLRCIRIMKLLPLGNGVAFRPQPQLLYKPG